MALSEQLNYTKAKYIAKLSTLIVRVNNDLINILPPHLTDNPQKVNL